MGLISKAVKGGVAAKVFSEAKKPKNQQKAKSAFSRLRSKFGGGSSTGTGTTAKSSGKGTVKGTGKTTGKRVR